MLDDFFYLKIQHIFKNTFFFLNFLNLKVILFLIKYYPNFYIFNQIFKYNYTKASLS